MTAADKFQNVTLLCSHVLRVTVHGCQRVLKIYKMVVRDDFWLSWTTGQRLLRAMEIHAVWLHKISMRCLLPKPGS